MTDVLALANLLAQHTKECASEHCSACDCGWDSDLEQFGDITHADHLARVVLAELSVTGVGA